MYKADYISALADDPDCVFVANSFSRHGLWGLLSAPYLQNLDSFQNLAEGIIDDFAHRHDLRLDPSASLKPFSFRLIPSNMERIHCSHEIFVPKQQKPCQGLR